MHIRFDTLVPIGELVMPTELPEDSSDEPSKKWRYRKPEDRIEELIHEPDKETAKLSIDEPEIDTTSEPEEEPAAPIEEEAVEVSVEEPVATFNETPEVEEEGVVEKGDIEQLKTEKEERGNQVSDLLSQTDEFNAEKKALDEQIESLTEQLEQANTDLAQHQEELTGLEAEVEKHKETEAQLNEVNRELQEKLKTLEETAKEREEHLLVQLEEMAKRIGKLQDVIRKRDEELVALQKDILVKKDMAQDAQDEVSKLRTVGIVQREAVQDTTVLRRRVTDLEVEYEKLRKALEKDPKYKIYLLVRETGQRTLEELSKILGVGVYEARRRVQELVRAGLLELKGEAVTVSR